MSVQHFPVEANVMVDALSEVPRGSLAYVDSGNKEVTSGIHWLVRLEVTLRKVENGSIEFLVVPTLLWLKRSSLSKALIPPC